MEAMMLNWLASRIQSDTDRNSEGPSGRMWTTPEEDMVKCSACTSFAFTTTKS
jgi:hypothetical protein